MVCEYSYILGWQNVAYYFKVYVALTVDLNYQKQLFFIVLHFFMQFGSSNMCDNIRRWLSGTY